MDPQYRPPKSHKVVAFLVFCPTDGTPIEIRREDIPEEILRGQAIRHGMKKAGAIRPQILDGRHVDGFLGCQCEDCKKTREQKRQEKRASRIHGTPGRPRIEEPRLPSGAEMTSDQRSRWMRWRQRFHARGGKLIEALQLPHVVGVPIGAPDCSCEMCEEYREYEGYLLAEMEEQPIEEQSGGGLGPRDKDFWKDTPGGWFE